MAMLEVICCDPLTTDKRKYAPRIADAQWKEAKTDVLQLDIRSATRKQIRRHLSKEYGLHPTCVNLDF